MSSRPVWSFSDQELARQVTYLKADNRILESKLPERSTLSNQERRTLVKHGKQLRARLKELVAIVSYCESRRWIRELEQSPSHRPPIPGGRNGRPRVEESVSDAIIRIRKESG